MTLAMVGPGVNMPVSQPLQSVQPVPAAEAAPVEIPVALPVQSRHEYPPKADRN